MKLIIFLESGLKRLEIFKPLLIGRSEVCDLVLKFSFISKKHCTIALITDSNDLVSWVIIDGVLGESSTNGTWLNGFRIEVEKLKDGDTLTFSSNEDIPKILIIIEEDNEQIDSTEGVE